MSRIDEYRDALVPLKVAERSEYLRRRSALPGPRANLELAQAAADVARPAELRRWLRDGDEFLALCGAIGLGRLLADGDDVVEPVLRTLASDPRWRVREGVAMALQRVGDAAPRRLVRLTRVWVAGNDFERRAAIAGLCEPRSLHDPKTAAAALRLLDRVTAGVERAPDRRADGFVALRKALAYCWSVAIVATPDDGRAHFERWATSADPDVRRIVRENLAKARLQKLDPKWVARLARAIS